MRHSDRGKLRTFVWMSENYAAYKAKRPLPIGPTPDEFPISPAEYLAYVFRALPEVEQTSGNCVSILNVYCRIVQHTVLPRTREEMWMIEDHIARLRPFIDPVDKRNDSNSGLRDISIVLHRLSEDEFPEAQGIAEQVDAYISSALDGSLWTVSYNGDGQWDGQKAAKQVMYGQVNHGNWKRFEHLERLGHEKYGPVLYHFAIALGQMVDHVASMIRDSMPEMDWAQVNDGDDKYPIAPTADALLSAIRNH